MAACPVLRCSKCSASGQIESTITTKGQATIPLSVRQHLGLKPEDRVKLFFHPDGGVELLPRIPVTASRGIVRFRGQGVTIEAMTEAVAVGAVAGRTRRDDR
jgi:antitoxin PrlF